MSSETDIANLALVPLLGCNRITNLDDNQTEAIVMKASYTHCRDTVLEARAWTFATTRGIWIPTIDTIPFGFTYSYQIPSTVLKVLTVANAGTGNVFSSSDSTFKWQREKDRVITDAESINVRYIEKITNTNQFSTGFVNALSLYLAWYNCVALTESTTLKSSLWAQYQDALFDAATADGQQGRKEQTHSTSLLRVR
jgi:hypothetical protein